MARCSARSTTAATSATPSPAAAAPSPTAGRGNGLWVVNQLCDLAELRTGSTGTTIRLHIRLRR